MEGFFETDLGRVHVHPSIVREVIWPELVATKTMLPANASHGNRDPESLRKHIDRTIAVQFEDGKVQATIAVQVEYGANIKAEAARLRERVVRALEAITGLEVGDLTINVEKVFPKAEA